jgi:hypothetical protein
VEGSEGAPSSSGPDLTDRYCDRRAAHKLAPRLARAIRARPSRCADQRVARDGAIPGSIGSAHGVLPTGFGQPCERRTRHRIAAAAREDPCETDLPMRRGRGPRAPASTTPPGTDSLRARVDELERAIRLREDVKNNVAPIAVDAIAARLDAIAVRFDQFIAKLHALLDSTRMQTEDLGLARAITAPHPCE